MDRYWMIAKSMFQSYTRSALNANKQLNPTDRFSNLF